MEETNVFYCRLIWLHPPLSCQLAGAGFAAYTDIRKTKREVKKVL
jgi:hypothetical protein